MEASSSSLTFSRYFHTVSELDPTTRREIGRKPGWAIPHFFKLRQDPLKSKYLPSRLCLASANGGGFRKALKGVGESDGVVIVDHGSRRKESNLMLNEFVVMFREKTKYPIVEPAHMELAEPSIKDAFNSCVQQGAKRVIVSPFFLFPGRHWHQDIPSLTAEAAKEHPGVSYVITAPLGLHELLVDVVNDRITYCLSHVAGEEDECSVCAGTGKCQLYN
ncbi:hypothetical protein Pfo_009122 [Paulownia fortunei]|nr:hypothetical protein Pfo_009122 [Paulownia fortunei]